LITHLGKEPDEFSISIDPHISFLVHGGGDRERKLCLGDPRTDKANSPYNPLLIEGRPNALLGEER
jgi:hypothetical protein